MRTILVVLALLVVGYVIVRLFARPGPMRHARAQPPPMDDTLPPAGESARKAAAFVRELGALVDRLAARDVAVDDLVCEPDVRWQLVVERGADRDDRFSWVPGRARERWVTRVSWDGGAGDLRVAKSIREPHLVPNRWQEEPGAPIGPAGDPMAAAEAFITRRFADGGLPPAGGSARESAEFVRELVAFTDRLAARDVCVRRLTCWPSWFWELVVQRGAEIDGDEKAGQGRLTRVVWDGKENDLSVGWAPSLPGSIPDDWDRETLTPLGKTDDAIGVAEDLLIRRFSGSTGPDPGPAGSGPLPG